MAWYSRSLAVVLLGFLPGALLAGSLAGCDALGKLGTADHYPAARNFTVSGRVTSVIIDAGGGSVDVTGSGRSTVGVSQQASYSSKPPVATRTLAGTTLTLAYTCPAEVSCAVSYTVQVPRGVSVQVSGGGGEITLTSLAGPVSAHSSAGLITAVDLRSPIVSLTTDAGGIIATCTVAPLSLHASTNLGPITLTVPGAVAYKISTRTFVGMSAITVRRSATSPHQISASSDVGSVSISPS